MKKMSLQSDYIKLWALIAMTADHFNKIIGHTEWLTNTVGRMAFPIFAFLIISNFCVYHPFKKYVARLAFFGCFTELILHYFRPEAGNILFTFLWVILFLGICEFISKKTKSLLWQGYWISFLFFLMLPLILVADYSLFGFLFMLALYVYQKAPSKLNCTAVFVTATALNFYSVWAVVFTLITVIMLLFGIKITQGLRIVKWWGFYFYYPLHQLFLSCLKELL